MESASKFKREKLKIRLGIVDMPMIQALTQEA